MVVKSNGEEVQEPIKPEYDRKSELKAFDGTKTGVKGLVDAGVTKIPRIFIHDKSQLNDISTTSSVAPLFSVPIIDFKGVDEGSAQRTGIIKKVRDACENFGFFQVVNHGIDKYIMDDMIDGVLRFHEQDTEVKKGFYSRDVTRKFKYNSNFDLYTGPSTNWRDTMYCIMAPEPPEAQELPVVCRYKDQITRQHFMNTDVIFTAKKTEQITENRIQANNMIFSKRIAVDVALFCVSDFLNC
ncbi:hypothetical protein RHSIM_Rhsim04G0186600 [Rhododendron simsii]|uniref:Non-haem dioxygenase N-terminal domain-containing protein n=1 Tax=Rhododendron simsii TaxID=118357 RepID=A0A834H622_RHOSS|nr:hypothetical protein RHSIM_Rhsim04G0186600 [Rhododendron simsii]